MLQRLLPLLIILVPCCIKADSYINVTFTFQGTTTVVQGIAHAKGYSFYGIPYAAPPVGNLRFKAAQPIKMPAFIDATKGKAACAQHSTGSVEDCLYINLFAPSNDTTSSTNPVYFWIHGGAFVGGNPGVPMGIFDNIVNQGSIITVAVYYRLGPFGFFTTRDQATPGNQALTDWIAALQWVQNYIRFFGGDPSKVTIGGQSAGAIATSFLTFTRKADNLFRASIMESGSAFLPSFMSYSDSTRNSSMMVALATGCATVDQWNKHDLAENQKILTCLQGKNTDEILFADYAAASYDGAKWGMVPDGDYYPDRLETLALQRRPIPVLHGVNNLEWLGWVDGFIVNNNMTGFTRQIVTDHLQHCYFLPYWKDPDGVFQAAKKLYIDPVTAGDDDHVQWCVEQMHLWSEMTFVGPSNRDARYLAFIGSKVYLYSLEVYPTALDYLILDPRLRGVAHALELPFVFDYNPANDTQQLTQGRDKTMKDIMGKLWVNFIRTGNPTPSSGGLSLPFLWEPLESINNYLYINENPYMAQNFYPRAQFWMCNATAMNDTPPPYC